MAHDPRRCHGNNRAGHRLRLAAGDQHQGQHQQRLLLPLALLLLLPASPAPAFAWPGPFCRSLVQGLSQCSKAQAVSSVDLAKYAGRWYEIGVSAQFGFQVMGQSGGQCCTANYTALGTVRGRETVRVVNRQLSLFSWRRRLQSVGVSKSASSAGLGVRLLCQYLVGRNPISDSMATAIQTATTGATQKIPAARGGVATQKPAAGSTNLLRTLAQMPRAAGAFRGSVWTYTQAIQDALSKSRLSDTAKSAVKAELDKIEAATGDASSYAESVFKSLEAVQGQNMAMNGGSLPAAYSLQSMVSQIKEQTAGIQAEADKMTASRQQILTSAMTIQRTAGVRAPGVAAAATGLVGLAQRLGPIGATTATIKTAGRTMGQLAGNVAAEPQKPRVGSFRSNAVQSKTTEGALTVGGRGPPNYKILKLIGDASQGYEMAYVWDCDKSLFNGFVPQNVFWLLSRTPSVPQSAIDSALTFLKDNGIFLGGDNLFLTVSQDSQLCTPVTSLT